MSIAELIAQKAELEQQIAQRQREERSEAIKQVMAIMSQYGLTAQDLSGGKVVRIADAKKSSKRGPVAIKYRDDDGHTWTGRGIKPRWLSDALASGKSLDDFLVAA
jgi:DNA-binding protein H-NS